MTSQPIVVGGTYDWFLNPAYINTEGAPSVFGLWDLTGATVTISFISPSGVGQHFTASIISATGGTAHYINLATLFNAVGNWSMSWKVANGSTILETQLVTFNVSQSGAGT